MGRCSDTVGAARGTLDKVGSLDCSKCTMWAEMPFHPRMRLTVGDVSFYKVLEQQQKDQRQCATLAVRRE